MPRRSLSQYQDLSESPKWSRTPLVAYAQKAAAPKTPADEARRIAAATAAIAPKMAAPQPSPKPKTSMLERLKAKHPLLAAFSPAAIYQWVTEYLFNRLFRRTHRFLTYRGSQAGENGVYDLTDAAGRAAAGPIRISIAGDWGTGTDEAWCIADLMTRFDPHYTIHLGDVYYVGTDAEIKEHCLGIRNSDNGFDPTKWPIGSVGSFGLNGNHEMYALGYGYFDVFLPRLGLRSAPGTAVQGQKASYFALKNNDWIIIWLDTGYHSIGVPILEKLPWFAPDSHLPHELLDWLQSVVKPYLDSRGIVLLSHHQYYSAFEEWLTKPAEQLTKVIDRPVLWLWGHEHRFATYGLHTFDGGIQAFGRCLGHGGMPVALKDGFVHEDCIPDVYDKRRYQGQGEPDDLVVGYNGFANLTLDGPSAIIEYRDVDGNLVLSERWVCEAGQLKPFVLNVMKDENVQTNAPYTATQATDC
jgi:hypothetical protein